jgi:PAS domain S-box-containing protein
MDRGHLSNNGHDDHSAVLVVNDAREQLDLLDSLLRKAGYAVVTAEDGQEAFEVAKRERPDLVISDVMMPRVNGIEFCRLVRQDQELQAVPILLLSALRKDTESIIEGLRAGADDYLELPVDSARLIAKVSRLLERSRLESALHDSEERYRLLFENLPQPIWVHDIDTTAFLAVNDAAVRTYGYGPSEFLSMTTKELRARDFIPGLPADISAEEESVISSPSRRHQKKDGSIIYVEVSSHRLRFKGKDARLVIANDVTERKLLDEEQKRMHASLRQSAIEWRQTFDAMHFPVLIVDLAGRINRLNQAAQQVAGIDSEEILGQEICQLGAGQPWEKASELLSQIRDNGTSSYAEVEDETTAKTWAITLYRIHELGSLGERAILIAQDISTRKELEASLRRSEMMSLLGSLIAGVAHEVRNPLFGISSILDAFETRFKDRTDYLRYTNVLRDELGRLNVLMEELLEYGKPFKGDLYLASVDEVIVKSLRSCMPIAELGRVKLVNSISSSVPKVMIDRRRLSKVFVNLIENAIQHSPPDEAVRIEVFRVQEGNQGWLDYAVKDCGAGILEEDIPKIFEPFFSKRRGGTGLGLAIASRIMEEHGGRLIARNNPDGGGCMVARFPLPTEESAS